MHKILATLLIALCALSTTASAQSSAKLDLAAKLAALQQGPELDRLVGQIANSAVQPMINIWAPKLDANVPKAKQQQAAEQLNAELKKYGDAVVAIVQGKIKKISEDALVTAYSENFSEDELRQLNVFFASPVVRKYQGLAPQLGNAVVQKLVEATKSDIQERAKGFEEAAAKIVGPDKAKK